MSANQKLQLRIGELMFALAQAEAVIEDKEAEIVELRNRAINANFEAINALNAASANSQEMLDQRGG